jgi:hypothetical protein
MSDAHIPDAHDDEQRRVHEGRILPDEPGEPDDPEDDGVTPAPARRAETPDVDALEQAEEVPEEDDDRR